MYETSNSTRHYDLVVIGSGAAGHHGAIQAAKLGKKVLVVEQNSAVGGACINTGTIPSKTLREAVYGCPDSGQEAAIFSPVVCHKYRDGTWRGISRRWLPTRSVSSKASSGATVSMF